MRLARSMPPDRPGSALAKPLGKAKLPTAASDTQSTAAFGEGFILKVFAVFAAMAVLSALISIGGKYAGRSIALGGHTEDQTLREIVIGNNVLVVPANAIRFENERRHGVAAGLHLYLKWPEMKGDRADLRDDFNHAGGARNILFLSFEPRMMSRDMSGRLEPIYRSLIRSPGKAGSAGLTNYEFIEKSGYMNEMLVVGPDETGAGTFVARCLTGAVAEQSLADCERDVFVGDDLALVYRFPSSLLAAWRRIDAAVLAYSKATIKTGT